MPIQVLPVTLEDWDDLENIGSIEGDDLAAPALHSFWPVTDPEAAKARNKWSMQQQREQFLKDSTARFVKAVDTDSKEIISLARWHYYSEGFQPLIHSWMEIDAFSPPGSKKSQPPDGILEPLFTDVMGELCENRTVWQTKGPAWVLTTLVSKSSARRRGAGGKLVEWGVKQADHDNLPSYIEASPDGLQLYLKYGFKHVGEFQKDFSEYGIEFTLILSSLKREPQEKAVNGV